MHTAPPPVSDLLNLRNQRVLVTGAGSGIGSAIARRLAEAGAQLALHYRKHTPESLADAVTVRYATEALVSTDIVGDPHSSIFDSEYTSVIGGNMLKTLSWYDNEWGYSNRVVDLLERMYALD